MILQNQYEILRLIGEGGMGKVFLARDIHIDRLVAVKVLAPEFANNGEILRRFESEAKIQGSLVHPNIVQLYTCSLNTLDKYIIIEYVNGPTLKEKIKQAGVFPEQQAIEILKPVLSALSYSHTKNVVHRDLKPSNILLTDSMIPKVSDYGIAKDLAADKSKTTTGMKLGTILYMSPEQIASPKNVDARSDVYSIGLTLYEMVTGNLPFDRTESDFIIMEKIVNGNFLLPSRFVNISSWLENVIMFAIHPDRNKRISSCDEFIRLLSDNKGQVTTSTTIETSTQEPIFSNSNEKSKTRGVLIALVSVIVVALIIIFAVIGSKKNSISPTNSASTENIQTYDNRIETTDKNVGSKYEQKNTYKTQNTNRENTSNPEDQSSSTSTSTDSYSKDSNASLEDVNASLSNTPNNIRAFFDFYSETQNDPEQHVKLYTDPTYINGKEYDRSSLLNLSRRIFKNNHVEDHSVSIESYDRISSDIVRVLVTESSYTNGNYTSTSKYYYLIDKGNGYKVVKY